MIKFLILVGLFTAAKAEVFEDSLEGELVIGSYVPDANYYGDNIFSAYTSESSTEDILLSLKNPILSEEAAIEIKNCSL